MAEAPAGGHVQQRSYIEAPRNVLILPETAQVLLFPLCRAKIVALTGQQSDALENTTKINDDTVFSLQEVSEQLFKDLFM